MNLEDYWKERATAKPKADNPLQYYPTPDWVTEALLDRENFDGRILEPACGEGAMVRVMQDRGYAVDSSDITEGFDFLNREDKADNIVTNPPFGDGVGEKFVRQALKLAEKKVAMLLPIYFLESKRRLDLFNQLSHIYFFCRRIRFGDEGARAPMGAIWLVWEQGFHGKTEASWIE